MKLYYIVLLTDPDRFIIWSKRTADFFAMFLHSGRQPADTKVSYNTYRLAQLALEVLVLALVVARVGHGGPRDLRVGQARVLPLRRARVWNTSHTDPYNISILILITYLLSLSSVGPLLL